MKNDPVQVKRGKGMNKTEGNCKRRIKDIQNLKGARNLNCVLNITMMKTRCSHYLKSMLLKEQNRRGDLCDGAQDIPEFINLRSNFLVVPEIVSFSS